MTPSLGFRLEYTSILLGWLDASLWRTDWQWQLQVLEYEPELFTSAVGRS